MRHTPDTGHLFTPSSLNSTADCDSPEVWQTVLLLNVSQELSGLMTWTLSVSVSQDMNPHCCLGRSLYCVLRCTVVTVISSCTVQPRLPVPVPTLHSGQGLVSTPGLGSSHTDIWDQGREGRRRSNHYSDENSRGTEVGHQHVHTSNAKLSYWGEVLTFCVRV